MKEYTNQELTEIYNRANNITEGKRPPISTEKIFAAMRLIAKESEERGENAVAFDFTE